MNNFFMRFPGAFLKRKPEQPHFSGRKSKPEQPYFLDPNYTPEEVKSKVIELHQKAVDGDKNAVQEAFSLLESVRRSTPLDNEMNAYYGSILTLQGRDARDPIERTEKVRKGLKYLDGAVQNEPDNVEIRTIRGYVNFNIPEVYFHRTKMAVEDFNYLINRYNQDPSIFTKEFSQQLTADLHSAYQTLDHKDGKKDRKKRSKHRKERGEGS